MNIPGKIRVGVIPYDVDLNNTVELDGVPHFGKIDFRNHTISIWSGLPPQRQFVTLLHEALHAIEADRNLELEEHEVDALAKGLSAFLVDNGFISEN